MKETKKTLQEAKALNQMEGMRYIQSHSCIPHNHIHLHTYIYIHIITHIYGYTGQLMRMSIVVREKRGKDKAVVITNLHATPGCDAYMKLYMCVQNSSQHPRKKAVEPIQRL